MNLEGYILNKVKWAIMGVGHISHKFAKSLLPNTDRVDELLIDM